MIDRLVGVAVAGLPGAGAAGGLGAGLIAFCNATIRSGFEVVADAVGLEERIATADIVVTGEGRLDSQSAFGKTTEGVARLARAASKPVIALAGTIDEGAGDDFEASFALSPSLAATPEDAMSRAGELLQELAQTEVAEWIKQRV